MSRQGQYDRHITIFSPDGKLYQIEYAVKAVSQCGLTGVCIRGKDTVCMVVQRKVPDKLMDRDFCTSLYKITPKIGCLAVGIIPDCKSAVQYARHIAGKYQDKNGYAIPVHVLAEKMGKLRQLFTQHAGVRPAAVTMHFCSIDDETGPQLWKCDPSGLYFGWKASSVGTKEQEANNQLEKIVRQTKCESDKNTTIQKAIDCLQVVLSQDLKPQDIEVSYVSGTGDFERCSAQEVEDHLNTIAEQDA